MLRRLKGLLGFCQAKGCWHSGIYHTNLSDHNTGEKIASGKFCRKHLMQLMGVDQAGEDVSTFRAQPGEESR